MDKLISFPGKSEQGIFTHIIDTEHNFLVKTACEYHPEIASYINNAKKIPGKTQILLTALGAGEFWGCNSNGDYFSEESLAYPGPEYGYKTFLNAHAFKHHVNKDPKAAYGDVAVSVYNPKFHRVELVVLLDNAKAGDIVEKIDNGEYPSWSMGAKLPYDVCSICGNKARTVREYCEHLKYYMGKIHPPTGKMAYAINPKPKFFDISYVFIGADKIARTLKKVASLGNLKVAEIKKEIPADDPPASQTSLEDDIEAVKSTDEDLPRNLLDNLALKHKLKDILSTMAMARIIPKPHEFQRLVLVCGGKKDLADSWENRRMHFDPELASDCEYGMPFGHENFDEDILDKLSPFMPSRSFSPPHLIKRITILVKRAEQEEWTKISSDRQVEDHGGISAKKQIAIAVLLAGLYHKFVAEGKNIKLLPGLLGLGATTLPIFMNKSVMPGYRGNVVRMEDTRRPNYIERHSLSPITKMGISKGTLGMAMTFGSMPLSHSTSQYLASKRMHDPDYREGAIKNYMRRYPEVFAIGGSAAGIGLLSGRPLPNKIYNMAARAGRKVNKILTHMKLGSAADIALDTLIWPLAMGGPNLAHRLVGSAIDQAAFEGIRRLSNKRSKDKFS